MFFNNLFAKFLKLTADVTDTTAVETTIEETTKAALKFTTENVGDALVKSVAGMVGIFIVIGIIILAVTLLGKTGKKDK